MAAVANRSVLSVRPRFLDRFACLADSCPDHCCRGWAIDIDPRTQRRFRTLDDPLWRRRFREGTTQIRDRAGKRRVIRLREDGTCPFLEEGLCGIHKRFGPAALPETCRLFPRKFEVAEGLVLASGSLACPEIARDVVVHADALAEVASGDPLAPLLADTGSQRARPDVLGPWQRLMLRRTMLAVLGDSRKPWGGRIALLLVLLEEAERAMADGSEVERVCLDVETVLRGEDLAGVEAAFGDTRGRFAACTAPLLRLFLAHLESQSARRDVAAYLRSLAERLAVGEDGGDPVRRYLERGCRELDRFLAAHRHLAGNVLAALLLQEQVPAQRQQGFWDGVWHAAFAWALWRFLVAAAMDEAQGPEKAGLETAHAALYRLGRYLSHCPHLLEECRASYRRAGLLQRSTLAVLLR